jgi:hypothetical protein
MLGLLAATQSGCNGDEIVDAKGSGGSASDSETSAGGMAGDGDSSGGGSGGSSAGGSSGEDSAGGEGGMGGAVGVTSSKIIPDLTLEEFTEMCGEAGGVVETHATCHGAVTGPGFSYDSDTDVFTEHTCAGYNTCTGFSCVIDD